MHLAALSNDPLGALAPQITYDINHYASVRLARLAKEAGVKRFLYASTCSVYGAAGDGLVDEDAPLRPLTPYADSKVRVEDDVAAMADDDLHPGLPAQRNGFRVLTAAACGHRAEQPGRACRADGCGAGDVGRHTVAPAGARARHRTGVLDRL